MATQGAPKGSGRAEEGRGSSKSCPLQSQSGVVIWLDDGGQDHIFLEKFASQTFPLAW